jgi:DNA-binding Lrp family transcriptional regulator
VGVAYILITVVPTYEHNVYIQLSLLPEFDEVYPVFGEYDLIAKITSEDIYSVGSIVVDKIRTIKGVIDTVTLTGLKFIAGF